jgi:hypothetical protein
MHYYHLLACFTRRWQTWIWRPDPWPAVLGITWLYSTEKVWELQEMLRNLPQGSPRSAMHVGSQECQSKSFANGIVPPKFSRFQQFSTQTNHLWMNRTWLRQSFTKHVLNTTDCLPFLVRSILRCMFLFPMNFLHRHLQEFSSKASMVHVLLW